MPGRPKARRAFFVSTPPGEGHSPGGTSFSAFAFLQVFPWRAWRFGGSNRFCHPARKLDNLVKPGGSPGRDAGRMGKEEAA